MKAFYLLRHEDVHGQSGLGVVAEGVVFSDGVVAMRWLPEPPSTVIRASVEEVIQVHGHGGKTELCWGSPPALPPKVVASPKPRGSRVTPAAYACARCGEPLRGTMVGVGDGSGQKFACRPCYDVIELERAGERERES